MNRTPEEYRERMRHLEQQFGLMRTLLPAEMFAAWAGTGRCLNVANYGPIKGRGNQTYTPVNFPIFTDLPDDQVLLAFVSGVNTMTGSVPPMLCSHPAPDAFVRRLEPGMTDILNAISAACGMVAAVAALLLAIHKGRD